MIPLIKPGSIDTVRHDTLDRYSRHALFVLDKRFEYWSKEHCQALVYLGKWWLILWQRKTKKNEFTNESAKAPPTTTFSVAVYYTVYHTVFGKWLYFRCLTTTDQYYLVMITSDLVLTNSDHCSGKMGPFYNLFIHRIRYGFGTVFFINQIFNPFLLYLDKSIYIKKG